MPEHQQIQQSKKSDTIFQKQATPASQTPASNPFSIIQRAKMNPKSLTHADVMQLQRTIGNRAVGMLLTGIGSSSTAQQATVQRQEIPKEEETCPSCMQRQEIPEEEEPLQGKMIEAIQRQEIPEEEETLQGKMIETIQRQEIPEEEEPLQGKFETIQRQEIPEEEEPLQGKMAETIQRQEIPEEEEPLQGKFESIQRQEIPEEEEPLQTKKENNTGMPDNLKASVENLSGIEMSDVRVHYNSSKPAEVGALAYTQGQEIHVAPGQEKHLPHEGWHVVQQAQGRVRPTGEVGGMPLNDSRTLESEADSMGRKAAQLGSSHPVRTHLTAARDSGLDITQRLLVPGEIQGLILLRPANQEKMRQVHTDLTNFGRNVLPDIMLPLNVIIVNQGGTMPAWTVDNGDLDGISVYICYWYVKMSTAGEILGMIAHELGVHTLADRQMSRGDREGENASLIAGYINDERGVTLAPYVNAAADPRQADHVAVAMDPGPGGAIAAAPARTQQYTNTMLSMGDVIAASGRPPAQIATDLIDLLNTFLFDIARLMATDDGGAFRTMWKADNIARLFNWYYSVVIERHSHAHVWLLDPSVRVHASGVNIRTWLLGKLAKYATT